MHVYTFLLYFKSEDIFHIYFKEIYFYLGLVIHLYNRLYVLELKSIIVNGDKC